MGRDLWSAANRIAPAAVRVRCLRESGAGPRDLARARGGRLHTSSGRRRGGHVATSAMDSARTGGRHGDVDAVAKRGLGNPCLVSIFVTFFFAETVFVSLFYISGKILTPGLFIGLGLQVSRSRA
jgi:hypothetical protein